MSKLAIWAQVEAKPGKEQTVAEFLKSAQTLAEKEQGTLTWYAVKLGGAKFGIFDTFADEKGREAHLNGEIAKALFAKAQELFVKEPEVHKIEILAAKAQGGAKRTAHNADGWWRNLNPWRPPAWPTLLVLEGRPLLAHP